MNFRYFCGACSQFHFSNYATVLSCCSRTFGRFLLGRYLCSFCNGPCSMITVLVVQAWPVMPPESSHSAKRSRMAEERLPLTRKRGCVLHACMHGLWLCILHCMTPAHSATHESWVVTSPFASCNSVYRRLVDWHVDRKEKTRQPPQRQSTVQLILFHDTIVCWAVSSACSEWLACFP